MNKENRRTTHKVKITSHLSGLCAHPTDEHGNLLLSGVALTYHNQHDL